MEEEQPARLIKKYSNRKLYDTRARRYITLERIGALLREGDNIQVVDRTTGEDLTGITLSQVLLDSERKGLGAVPERVLQQLVKGPQEALKEAVGAVRHSIREGEAAIQRAEVRAVRAPEVAIEEALERTLRRLRIPTHRDFERLSRRIDQLADRVDDLGAARASSRSDRSAPRSGRAGRTRARSNGTGGAAAG